MFVLFPSSLLVNRSLISLDIGLYEHANKRFNTIITTAIFITSNKLGIRIKNTDCNIRNNRIAPG